MKQIVLASASPRRKKLLQQINLPFEVHPSSVEENYNPEWSPGKIVKELSLKKGKNVATDFSSALVISADTIVTFEDTILEKPEDANEAYDMLTQLSNNTHQVYTGVALCKTDQINNIAGTKTFFEVTDVTFGKLNPQDIKNYVEGGSPMDKAGSYGIQDDFGAIFVKRIEGDYNNVVGFPLHSFYNTVRNFAGEFLPNPGN
ncbi:Maf family protein [Fodinibius halophilus]|uniref:dTTP/UTP pyrophosphatase n=1 Tax=Fodinibius halophilus TaxID=1736908 RepID=A0A6M1SYU5_9BACT|nr:Maf family protein [Fodinibius halophilus]NGP86827.1 septum formation protein Maf [Fodinibius halophilus]